MVLKPGLRRKFIVLTLFTLALVLFSRYPHLVERYYSQGVYPYISKGMRLLLGWVHFSVGDLLYACLFIYIVRSTIRNVRGLRSSLAPKTFLAYTLLKSANFLLTIYILFQVLWGLNYSRMGIAAQLDLQVIPYSQLDVKIAAQQVLIRLSEVAAEVDTLQRRGMHQNDRLKAAGMEAYQSAQGLYPFLQYASPSVKPSLFTPLGHFVGFTGYYNPFTAEAQIKTSIPVFLKPFVVTHEMAHQLGYAKESEANFVAFLTSRSSADKEVRYAVYFELFLYTLSELRQQDSTVASNYRKAAPPQVQRDLAELAHYLEKSRNPVAPYMEIIYDNYLRWNNQPKGRLSYNEVVMWLVAYGKKYGKKAI